MMPVFSSISVHVQPATRLLVVFVAMIMATQNAVAQLRIEITEGMVAPTPIAIADFTGADGRVT
ncbi:MAG: hypothetical protein VW830_02155, partial [Rhodobiaceae bacterium]